MDDIESTYHFSSVDSRFNETCGADIDELVEHMLREVLEQIAAGTRGEYR